VIYDTRYEIFINSNSIGQIPCDGLLTVLVCILWQYDMHMLHVFDLFLNPLGEETCVDYSEWAWTRQTACCNSTSSSSHMPMQCCIW